MRAHQGDVGGGVGAQQPRQRHLQIIGHVLAGAVEIDAGAQIEAAERRAVDGLRQAQRIGRRHQYHFAVQPPLRFQRRQLLAQAVRHQHAGHFVGVQRRLQIDFRPRADAAEMQAVETMEVGDAVAAYLHGGRQVVEELKGGRLKTLRRLCIIFFTERKRVNFFTKMC